MKTFIQIASWATAIWTVIGLANMMEYSSYYDGWSFVFAFLIIAQSITVLIYIGSKK